MKKLLPLIIIVLAIVFFTSCGKEENFDYDAEVQIDSLKQDTINFGMYLIPGNLHVYYSVINNDFDDVHSYVFTIHATNSDNTSYNSVIRSYKGVQGNSVVKGEAIMGIGQSGYSAVEVQDEKFE